MNYILIFVKKSKAMKYLSLIVFTFFYVYCFSQNIMPVKVVSIKKSGYDNLKWLAYTNDKDSIFCKNKPKIGDILHYKDTLHGQVYNVSEYETNLFDIIKNKNYFYDCKAEITVVGISKNRKNSKYKWTVITDQNMLYQTNYKHKKGDVVFCIDTNNNIAIKN